MGKLSPTEVTCHRQPLLLLLWDIGISSCTMGLQLMLFQLLLRILGLVALLTLHLLALGYPAALHMHLQTAVEVEAFVTGLTHEALLGSVGGGRRVFLLSLWQGTSLSWTALFPRLAAFLRWLGYLLVCSAVGFAVTLSAHLPPLPPSTFLGKEACR